MISYLSYETEKREIRMIPVQVLELELSVTTSSRWQREYSDSFEISFINLVDAYDFLKFYEIEQSEITWKYIKNDLVLYHKDMRINFHGSFPKEINYFIDNQSISIHYDYFETNPLNEQDELILKSQVRELKLKSIGI